MNIWGGVQGARNIRRFGTIVRVLAKHGFGDLADRIFRRTDDSGEAEQDISPPKSRPGVSQTGALHQHLDTRLARRLRLVLEELGPSFIKLGQLMSTRADLFPPQYIDELTKLQDRVPPVAYTAVKQVIEDELQATLDTIFSTFEIESLAAASVAQVHSAVLHSGEKVAVKVIRPGIEKQIHQDIRLMYFFARRLERAFELAHIVGLVNLVKEFERTIFRELDMLIEAGNIERFAANFEDSEEIYISNVYWEYTARSVLTMEHIDGIKMDQVESIRSHGIDPKEIAMIGLRSFSRQLMDFGLFHADPHPGNTIVMYDGRVSLVDFGITGYLDQETMLQIANIFLGYSEHDYDMIINAFNDAGLIDQEQMDLKNFRIDLKDISEPFYGRSLKTISVKDVYDQIMQLVLKYNIRLPRNLLLLLKTFIQTEALGKILDSDASILEVTKPYAKALLRRGDNARKILYNMGRETRQLAGYMRMAPKFIHDILKATARGKQALEIRHTGLDRFDHKLEKGVNRLTVGLVISASLIAAALVLNSTQATLQFSLPIFGGHTISLTGILGILGYSMATVLGFWLVISIFRSGKM